MQQVKSVIDELIWLNLELAIRGQNLFLEVGEVKHEIERRRHIYSEIIQT